MEWSEMMFSLVTALLGGGIGVLATLKSARKKADAEAIQAQALAQKELETIWAARLDQMREEVDYERQRNIALDEQHKKEIDYCRAENAKLMERNQYLIERMTDKENRFQEQTQVVRKHVAEVIDLTKRNGDLEVELAMVRCEDQECPFRRPPNAHTPAPVNLSKDDWHKKRKSNG